MTTAVAAAMVLECFFAPPAGSPAVADGIPHLRTPLSPEIAQSLLAKRPPVSTDRYAGEAAPAAEWTLGQRDAATGQLTVLRVGLATDPARPSPYAARYGTVTPSSTGPATFTQRLTGWCKLDPAEAAPR